MTLTPRVIPSLHSHAGVVWGLAAFWAYLGILALVNGVTPEPAVRTRK